MIRRWLLRLLGYDFVERTPMFSFYGHPTGGTLDDAMYFLRHDSRQWLPMGAKLEIGVRHVPEVPLGTVRVVIEVCR